MPGAVNFYLKKSPKSKNDPKRKDAKALIYLKFKYNGQVLVYTFGQSIDPNNWNPAKQRVKSNKQTTADGDHSLNDLLKNLEEVCENAYKTELKNGIPLPSTLKKHLNEFIEQNINKAKGDAAKPTLFKLIDRFINNEIHHKGKKKAAETLKKYVTVKGHLEEFQAKKKYKIDFDTITLDFYYRYINFLNDKIPARDLKNKVNPQKGLKQNSIAKDIQVIKTFMAEAVDLGYTANLQFKNRKFTASWEEVENIYLTDKEIINLYNYNLSKNKKLEQVRDLFVFGCFTGLRFSDYSSIKPENIVTVDNSLFIKMKTKKTGERVIIPCNPVVIKIFEKYSDNPNRLPNSLSNQKFNEYIKEACKLAKMTDTGRLTEDATKPLYELVSSHTARRSFATNLYLEGFPTLEIMKITGHLTEKAFLKYIKVSKLESAKKLDKHIQMKWSEKLLKVVA